MTTGQYSDLNSALQALFAELKRKATPMFHCSDAAPKDTKQYLLSVPASCTRIKQAADEFKAANGSSVVIQHSQVNFRISMQSVRCAIPMFAYEGLKTYESTYYQSTPEARLGCRLYDGPKAQWEHLPSPIPRRSRGGLLDAVPQTIRTLEEAREKSFYALLDTPALKLEKVTNARDYNCVFYPSQRLDACGVWQMWQDANLKGYDGEWDRKEIEEVLAKLRNYRENGLPGDTEIVTEVGGGAVIRKVMILQECWKFADGAYKNKIENMLESPEKEEEYRKACLQIAVEFYLSSMPTFEQGEEELKKYGQLDDQIARLQAILDDMDRLPAECKQIIQILLTGQVALSEQGDSFLYKDPDGKLVSDVAIKCPNTVIKEWELLRQLRELENDENPHRSAVAKRIVKQAMTAYNAVKSSKDRDQMQAMQAALAELDKRVKTCCNRHTSALASGDSSGYTYTAKGLEFYETRARCITELSDELTDMMPAPAYTPAPAPVVTGGGGAPWTCASCGAQNAPNAKFCSNCGSKPAPAPAASGFCPNCGAQNAPGAKFCGGCGAKLGEPAPVLGLCPACGAQNDPNAKFCNSCGTKLGGAPVTPPGLCTACGTQNAPGAKFCGGCGNTLN